MSPTLPDAAYDTRNQGRVVSHSELSLIAESFVTDAERSNRRVTCLLHIISDGTRVRHTQGITLSILRAPPLDHVQVAAVRAAWHQW